MPCGVGPFAVAKVAAMPVLLESPWQPPRDFRLQHETYSPYSLVHMTACQVFPPRSHVSSLLSFVQTKYCCFSPLPLKTHLGTFAAVFSVLRVRECWSRVAYAQWWGSSLLDKCALPHCASLHPLWVGDDCGGGEGIGASFWLTTCLEWQKWFESQKERSLHIPS